MKKYFDTHCHLNGQWYKTDLKEDLESALKAGVDKILLPGTSKKDSFLAIEMSKRHPNLYAAVGIHPCDAVSGDEASFLDLINPSDIVAIGETGLDLYHMETNPSLENQIKSFSKHIDFALKHNKPIIIHARNAEEEVYKLIKDKQGLKFIMHCYTGNWEWAEKFIALGGYISFAGAITYAKTPTIEEVAIKAPLDRILSETDAPFLTPVPHRGKTNKPEYVAYVAEYIAKVRSEDNEVVIKALYENALKVFGL